MPHIFISYRRDDAEYVANILADRIRATFGAESVFMDIDTIPFGVDFRKYIHDAVARCHVMLAIIGDDWLVQSADSSQRRIDEDADFVRLELEAALAREIPVIPVLIGRAKMPRRQDLPASLELLAFRNATELRPGRDMNHHLEQLIGSLRSHLEAVPKSPNEVEPNLTGDAVKLAEPEMPADAVTNEWTASYEGHQIKVTNWWHGSGKGLAKLYVDGICVDSTSEMSNASLRGTIQDRTGTVHVLAVEFGGILTVKAKILVDGIKIGGDR